MKTGNKRTEGRRKLPAQELAKKALQEFSLVRLLPNLATVAALCTGLSSIWFALQDRYEEAVIAMLVAAFFDAIDGRIARLLKVTSEFGAELDSLSDFISFGVAPAVIMYMVVLHQWGGLGWGICVFFAVCTALRLARFNVMNLYQGPQSIKTKKPSRYFVGVPAPAGGFLAFLPLILVFSTGLPSFLSPYLSAFFLITSGLLMVSRLRTYAFKSVKISRQHVVPIMIGAAVLVASIVSAPWVVANIVLVLYLCSIPFSVRQFRRESSSQTDSDD